MPHHLYRPIDASFESLQKRLRAGQLSTPELNQANRDRFHLPSLIVREAVVADRIVGMDQEAWDRRLLERRQGKLLK